MRIDEFEFRNEKGQEIEPTKAMLVCYIKALHKDIKILDKALELACGNSNFQQTCDFCEYREYSGSGECPCYCETEQGFEHRQAINYFKQQAEREVKNETTK